MRLIQIFLLYSLLAGCIAAPVQPPKSALQTREIQTRSFDSKDERLVMKAVLNALQDEGYIAKNAVVELGLLTAVKEAYDEDRTSMFVSSLLNGQEARWRRTTLIEANANVSRHGTKTRLRISFQRKYVDNAGSTMYVENILDPYFYQQFFAKVDQSIFFQKQKI